MSVTISWAMKCIGYHRGTCKTGGTKHQHHQQQTIAAAGDEDDENEEGNMIASFLQSLAPDNKTWCPYHNIARPVEYDATSYVQCSSTLAPAVDKHALHAMQALSSSLSSSSSSSFMRQQQQQPHHLVDWSPIYASLPVLRTTILREPFSWLLSKFFWHRVPEGVYCDDLDMATNGGGISTATSHAFQVDVKVSNGQGWLNRHAWYYILILCGEDCDARYFMGVGNLQQMERQAANNIRHAIAVVGLLNETERFYDMVSARVVRTHSDVMTCCCSQ
jgi:translation initiation factor 2B subunit (eIF-2B alpha/beta/delta family)